jgi:hypothetical protein
MRDERQKTGGGQTMDELYRYMREKMDEMHEARSKTVEIDCVEFMQMLKIVCYMRQIRRIANDDF